MKRLVCVLLVVVMTVAMLPQVAFSAFAEEMPTIVALNPKPLTIPVGLYGYEDYNDTGEKFGFHYDWSGKLETEVTFSDGGTVIAVGSEVSYKGDTYWLNAYDEQSREDPWVQGGTYDVWVEYVDVRAATTVTIGEPAVQEIRVDPIVIDYGTYWHEEYDYDEMAGEKRYNHYDWENLLCFTAIMKDGTTVSGDRWYEYDGWSYNVTVSDDQSFENPWDVGTHEATARILGVDVPVQVEIRDLPIADMQITPLQMYRMDETEIYREDSNGYGSYFRGYDWQWYLYYVVTFKDGTVAQGNCNGIDYNGNYYPAKCTDNQTETNLWTPGNTYTVTLEVMNRVYEIPVAVHESPIARLTMEPIILPEKQCGYEDENGNWIYNWYSYLCYSGVWQDGTAFIGNDTYLWYSLENVRDFGDDFKTPDGWVQGIWETGNTYQVPLSVLGYETVLNVTILPEDQIERPRLKEDTTVSVLIRDHSQESYATFTPTKTGVYQFIGHGDTGADAKLYTEDMTLLAYGDAYAQDHMFVLEYRLQAGVTYILGVSSWEAMMLPVSVAQKEIPKTELQQDVSVSAQLTGENNTVSFIFTPKQSDTYIFAVNDANVEATLYNADGAQLDYAAGRDIYLVSELTAGQTYTLDVSGRGNSVSVSVCVSPKPEVVSITGDLLVLKPERNGSMEQGHFVYSWKRAQRYTVTFSDGKTVTFRGWDSEVTHNGVTYPVALTDTQGVDGNWWQPGGNYTVSVTVGGFTANLPVQIENSPAVRLTAQPLQLYRNTCGYSEGGDYTYYWWDWVTYTLEFADGTAQTVKGTGCTYGDSYYALYYTDDQSMENLWDVGTHTVTLRIMGLQTSVTVEILETPADRVIYIPRIESMPKTEYFVGDPLDLSGLSVTVYCTDGTYRKFDYTDYGPIAENYDPETVGQQTVTVRLMEDVTVSFTVTVAELVVTGLYLDCYPGKTWYYTGETLDLSGMYLRVQYNNGREAYIYHFETDKYTVTGFDPWQTGYQYVTISVGEASTQFEVYVQEPKPMYISIHTMPYKTIYQTGEELDLSGLEVVACYDNGNMESVTGYTWEGFDPWMEGLQTVFIYWDGHMTQFDVTVQATVQMPDSIRIWSEPYRTVYQLGEEMDLSGLQVVANYSDGRENFISNYRVEGFDSRTAGPKTVTVSWNGLTTEFYVTVEEPTPSYLYIQNYPWKTTYQQGEELDLTGLEVAAYYSNGETRMVTDYTLDWYDIWMVGSQTIRVTWNGFTAEFYITVEEPKPTGIAIRTSPWRTTYQLGEMLDLGGLEVVAYYSNGMESNLYEYDYTVEGFDSWMTGMQTVRINWNGWTAEFYVTVEEPIPTSLYIQTYPWQTTYQQGEELNLEGMEVYAYYSNGEMRQVWDYTVENYDAWMVGPQTVTLRWNGLYADFTVTVEEPIPVSLEMLCAPGKTVYQMGEELELAGLELAVNYSNGRRDTVYDYTAEGYDPWMEGSQTVRLNWNGFTVEFYVVVEPPVPTGIEIRMYPQKNVYLMGEELDLSGMEVVAYYSNGMQSLLCDYTVEGFDSWMTGMQTIRVSWNGYTAEFYVTVEEPIPTQLEIRTYPHKLTYQLGEEFDFTGTELVAWYNNGSDKFVYEYALEGYDPWMTGVQTVRFSWNGLSVDFMVTVEAPVPVELTVDKLPDKIVYAPGEELDLTGMEVVVHYQDGKKETVTDYSVEGFESWLYGPQKVRLYWGSLMTEFEVFVGQMNLIVKQPQAVHAETGTEVQFHVEAEGAIVSYKWEYRKVWKWFNTSMTGYNTDTLTVTATGARNGYDYRCIITFADGTVLTSEMAELTVTTYITDVQSPNDQTVVNGYKGQFTAAAEGEGIKYKWYYKRPDGTKWIETSMEGNNKPTVMIETNAQRDGYQYRCLITDVTGNVEVWTEPATMRVLSFTSHPAEAFAATGTQATFTVTTSVDSGFTYQWQYRKNATANWTNTSMTGYNTATLTVDATLARNGYEYRCVLTGSKNSKIESKGAVLHVGDPVVFTTQPANVTVAAGEVATFTVTADNAFAYQWQYKSATMTAFRNTSADGNQTATLNITTKTSNNGYQYRCVVTGLDGQEYISEAATLTVG